MRAARRLSHAHTPWARLALFPLAFDQSYFLGFENFLLSLPLLFLALLDLEDFATRPIRAPTAFRHAAYLAVPFLCHPFSALLHLASASVYASFAWERFQPYYRYVLVRGAHPLLKKHLADYAIGRARSGEWAL